MPRIACALAIVTALAAPAAAATFSIPAQNSVATITAPDTGWKVKQTDRGIELNSNDDEVFWAIESLSKDDPAEIRADGLAFLARAGVTVEAASEKHAKGTLNGFETVDMGWNATDKKGDVIVHLTIIKLAPGKSVLFTYWASPDGDQEYDAITTDVATSLKAATAP